MKSNKDEDKKPLGRASSRRCKPAMRLSNGGPRKVSSMLFLLSLIAFSVIVFFPNRAYSAQITLSWNAPTTNVDGTPLTDLSGYKVYYGDASRSYPNTVNVGNVTTYTLANLSDGTYYFVVTAYDTFGYESNFSNEVSAVLQSAQQYTLAINRNGAGTVTGPGINCGTGCSNAYAAGTVVTLSASPGANSFFAGWSGGGCSGSGTCSTTINANETIMANFALAPPLTVTATAGIGGSISPSGLVSVSYGMSPTFTIIPDIGYAISQLVVDDLPVGSASSYSFLGITTNHVISASFVVSSCPHQGVRFARATPVYFSKIQGAYDAAVNGDVIQIQAANFGENVTLNRNISVTLKGGYDCDFLANSSFTRTGPITISNGPVFFEKVIVQ